MTYGLRDVHGQVVEVCDECGFDARFIPDVGASVEAAFTEMLALQQRPHVTTRPASEVWSAAEYADHVLHGSNAVGALVAVALRRPAPEMANDLTSARAASVQLARSISDADRLVSCPFEGAPTDVGRLVLHLLHDLEHHVLDVRRGYAALVLATSAAVYPLDP